MTKLEQLKRNYAEETIKCGINIQKGQTLLINSPIECAEFARMCSEQAYLHGAKEVIISWRDDVITKQFFTYADDETVGSVHQWDVDMLNTLVEKGAARLSIYAEDPENLKGIDSEKITKNQMAKGKATEDYFKKMTRNEFQWCVVSAPIKAWNKAVFPDLSDEEAEEKMWEEILKFARVEEEDTIKKWEEHSKTIKKHVDILNEYNFKSLHYQNGLGTDFTVELPQNHYWAGGEENSTKGIPFSANIPTEEVFTLPLKDSLNGKIVASKPLCISGNIIKDFYFIVKDGKIIEAHAKQGEDVLKDAISIDEGASYFGEVALVPYDSPISNSNILFLNTLFDENASCHLAFGEAYPCIKGAENMSEDELKTLGVNYSMTHEDFMVGTADLSIIGTTQDGKEIPVFVNGNFAF